MKAVEAGHAVKVDDDPWYLNAGPTAARLVVDSSPSTSASDPPHRRVARDRQQSYAAAGAPGRGPGRVGAPARRPPVRGDGHLRVRPAGRLLVALVLLAVAVALSLAVGTRPVPPSAVLDALLHGGSSPDALVVRSLRLPRTAIGLTAGAALGLAGAALQAVTRNPLADPGILGLSQGAAAGVVVAISSASRTASAGMSGTPSLGAVAAACLVYAIASGAGAGPSP